MGELFQLNQDQRTWKFESVPDVLTGIHVEVHNLIQLLRSIASLKTYLSLSGKCWKFWFLICKWYEQWFLWETNQFLSINLPKCIWIGLVVQVKTNQSPCIKCVEITQNTYLSLLFQPQVISWLSRSSQMGCIPLWPDSLKSN